jgi:D-amino peptidase
VKVFISADMEGATGVVTGRHTASNDPEFGRMRKLLTGDVNAAVEGAVDAGAAEVLVNDSHGSMINILIEELHPKARLISGSNKLLCQMEGIDGGHAAALFVAYHAREGGGDGILNHTLMGRIVHEITCNGVPYGETGLNAGLAGHFGVPVVLVTGDDKVAAEAVDLLGPIETAVVKDAVERLVANCLPPVRTRDIIRLAAGRAVRRAAEIPPHVVPGPVTFRATFKSTAGATLPLLIPQVRRVDPKTIEVTGDDYLAAFKLLWGALLLGRAGFEGAI